MLPKINSAHGSDTRNVINAAIDAINVQGKTIQDLVAEGQLTPAQYARLITDINGLIKSGEVSKSDLNETLRNELESFRKKGEVIDLDEFSERTLQAISGNASFNLLSVPRDKSVTPEKTTFIQKSTNLFNPDTALDGITVMSDGELVEGATRVTSAPIEVKGGDTVWLSGFIRIVYFDDDDQAVGFRDSGDVEWSSTVPESAKYARVNYNKNLTREVYQVNISNELLPYEPYYLKMDAALLGASKGVQLNYKLNFEYGSINHDDGIINNATVVDYETTRRTSKPLNVVPGSALVAKYDDGNLRVFEYDSDLNFIRSIAYSDGEMGELSGHSHYVKFNLSDVGVKYIPDCEITYFSPRPEVTHTKNKGVINTLNNLNFVFKTNTNKGRDILDPDNANPQYDEDIHFGAGLLRLPPNYKHDGKPTRLIIFGSGSGGYMDFDSRTFGGTYENYFQYLANEGYAILSVYTWTTKNDIRANENYGSPTTISNIISGYNWVVENYNIDKTGVIISGKSAGGFTMPILAYNKGLPVLAMGLLAPALNPLSRPYGYTLEGRVPYAEDFGFEGDVTILDGPRPARTQEVQDYIITNFDKMIGYNTLTDGIINVPRQTLAEWAADNSIEDAGKFDDVVRVLGYPVKIWIAEDDANVSADNAKNYIESIKNGNGIGELRIMPNGTGAHWSVDSAENALRVNVTTSLGIQQNDVPLAYAEMVQFFRRFES